MGKKTSRLGLGSAAIAVLALTHISSATVLLSEYFDTRTLSAQLPDSFATSWKNADNSIPGGVYRWYSQPAMETITVTGPVGTNASQSASINYATGSANDSTTSIILGRWAPGVTSGILDIKFSVMTPLNDGLFSVYIGSPWSANMATRLTLTPNRLDAWAFVPTFTDGQGQHNTSVSYTAGGMGVNTWTSYEVICNLTDKTFDILANNTQLNTAPITMTSAFTGAQGVILFQISGDISGTTRTGPTIYVDNMEATTAVPEPATLSALSLAVGALLIRRR